jgi:hypothetical protein
MAARKQYLLRIDPELWADVEHWAADELRSVNAQVEWILRDAVRRRGRGQEPGPANAGETGPRPDAPGAGGRRETQRERQAREGGSHG